MDTLANNSNRRPDPVRRRHPRNSRAADLPAHRQGSAAAQPTRAARTAGRPSPRRNRQDRHQGAAVGAAQLQVTSRPTHRGGRALLPDCRPQGTLVHPPDARCWRCSSGTPLVGNSQASRLLALDFWSIAHRMAERSVAARFASSRRRRPIGVWSSRVMRSTKWTKKGRRARAWHRRCAMPSRSPSRKTVAGGFMGRGSP